MIAVFAIIRAIMDYFDRKGRDKEVHIHNYGSPVTTPSMAPVTSPSQATRPQYNANGTLRYYNDQPVMAPNSSNGPVIVNNGGVGTAGNNGGMGLGTTVAVGAAAGLAGGLLAEGLTHHSHGGHGYDSERGYRERSNESSGYNYSSDSSTVANSSTTSVTTTEDTTKYSGSVDFGSTSNNWDSSSSSSSNDYSSSSSSWSDSSSSSSWDSGSSSSWNDSGSSSFDSGSSSSWD
jgi:hypothetical protein